MNLEIKVRTETGWRNPTLKDIDPNGILEMMAHLDNIECVIKVSTEHGEAFFTSSVGEWYEKFTKEGRRCFRIKDVHKAFGMSHIASISDVFPGAELISVKGQ